MECLWVEYEDCMWEEAYKEMVNPSKEYKNQNEFTNNFCKFCLEGKKIQFIRDLGCGFEEAFGKDKIWEFEITKLIVDKLME